MYKPGCNNGELINNCSNLSIASTFKPVLACIIKSLQYYVGIRPTIFLKPTRTSKLHSTQSRLGVNKLCRILLYAMHLGSNVIAVR